MNFIFSGKFYLIICFVFCFVFLTLEQEKKIMRNWNKTEWAQDRSFQNKIWCFFQNLVSPKCLLCLLTSICITTVTQQTHLCWPRVGRCGSATVWRARPHSSTLHPPPCVTSTNICEGLVVSSMIHICPVQVASFCLAYFSKMMLKRSVHVNR